MKKWLRWQGLGAFVVLTAFFFAFFLLFVDGCVKRTIEKTGTAIIGARVELDEADLSFFPLGLRLSRMQVTNPDQPMTNAVEISRIAFSMDSLNLLRRKVIIEEMAVDRVRFKTPRKTSGAISRRPSIVPTAIKRAVTEKLQLPSFELPDIREILEKEELESMRLVQSVRDDIQAEKEKWQQQLDKLPDQDKLEEYRSRIKKLKSARKRGLEGILGGATDMIALRNELKEDLDRIKTARKTLKEDVATLQKRVDQATRAPLEDVRRLRDRYSLSPQGLSNISRMLLGGQVGDWIETVLRWHERLKPVLARVAEQKEDVSVKKPIRGKGVDVRFKEHRPLPDFLIRTAGVTVEIPAGVLSGQVRHITPDQDVIGVPLTFEFSGEKMKDLQFARIEGEFNRVKPSNPRDHASVHVKGYKLQDLVLSKNKNFPVALNKGQVDFQARAVLASEALDANLSAGLKSVQMTAGLKEDAKPLASVIASTLSDIQGFNLEADISGTLKDYDMRLTSDLDRVLKKAVGKQVQEQAARLEAKLNTAIYEKVGKELSDLKSGMGGLSHMVDELTARLKLGDGLLEELVESGKGGLKLPF